MPTTETKRPTITRSSLFPSVSVIALAPQGVFTRSLMRHWWNRPECKHDAPWYELVLRIPETTTVYTLPLTRLQAAQVLCGEAL